jgi:hypothetical protein
LTRARLAVFLAAAIVFAPGTSFGDDSPQRKGSDVAARILAPTFDDDDVAAYQIGTLLKNSQKQDRRNSQALLALAALVGVFYFANTRFREVIGNHLRHQIWRVVSSHRDRGPPHLQLI